MPQFVTVPVYSSRGRRTIEPQTGLTEVLPSFKTRIGVGEGGAEAELSGQCSSIGSPFVRVVAASTPTDKALILVMGSDPEPIKRIVVKKSQCPEPCTDSD